MPPGVAIRIEPTPRRIRVLFNKKIIADTKSAKYVWEHEYYPMYYLPATDVQTNYLEKLQVNDHGNGHISRLTVGNRTTDKVMWFDKGELDGLIRFQFNAMGIYSLPDIKPI